MQQDQFMQEDYKLKLGKDGSITFSIHYEAPKTFEKTRTIKSDELNFFIPEKWDYNSAI